MSGSANVGALIGYESGGGDATVTDGAWDADTTGQTTSTGGGASLTTAEMQDKDDSAFDNWAAPWFLKDGQYPLLIPLELNTPCDETSAPFGGGDGSTDYPYSICTPDQLDEVRNDDASNFILAADIDLSTQSFDSIAAFSGDFNGDEFTIDNYSESGAASGFIGVLAGTLRNLNFTNASLTGASSTGIAVGSTQEDSDAAISNVHVQGSIAGTTHIAGVIGPLRRSATLERSSFTGTVTASGQFAGGVADSCAGLCEWLLFDGTLTAAGKTGGVVQQLGTSADPGTLRYAESHGTINGGNQAGGVVGLSARGSITDSYSDASITGSNAAGCVGVHFGTEAVSVERCYAAGSIQSGNSNEGLLATGSTTYITLVDCVWDIEATGQATTTGDGTGLTTNEMQDPDNAAFTNWSEPWILESGSYPTLDRD